MEIVSLENFEERVALYSRLVDVMSVSISLALFKKVCLSRCWNQLVPLGLGLDKPDFTYIDCYLLLILYKHLR